MEYEPLEVKIDGKDAKMRRITFSDYSAVRQQMRKQQMEEMPENVSKEIIAQVLKTPISDEEVFQWMLTREGATFIASRCLNHFFQGGEGYKEDKVHEALMQDTSIFQRLLEESQLITPQEKKGSSED